MGQDEWELEMNRMLDSFANQALSSLEKIDQRFAVLGRSVDEEFCQYFIKMLKLRYTRPLYLFCNRIYALLKLFLKFFTTITLTFRLFVSDSRLDMTFNKYLYSKRQALRKPTENRTNTFSPCKFLEKSFSKFASRL